MRNLPGIADPRHAFVIELAVDFDPVAAAERAGYSHEDAEIAAKFATEPAVRQLLEALRDDLVAAARAGVDRLAANLVDRLRTPSERQLALDVLLALADAANDAEARPA